MKKKLIFTISFVGLIVVAALSVTAITQSISKENERDALLSTPGLEHLSWNEDLNEYYNGDDFIWNSNTQQYEIRLDNKVLPTVDEVVPIQQWMEENEDTDDYIKAALVSYQKKYDQYFLENPLLRSRSDIVICEDAQAVVTDLGIPAIVDLYEYLVTDGYMSPPVMCALEEITDIYADTSPSTNIQKLDWMVSFEEKVIQASEATITSVADVENCGIFSVLQAEELFVDNSTASLNTNNTATLNAVNTMMEEKGITQEDIPTIRAFVEYVKAVHTAR